MKSFRTIVMLRCPVGALWSTMRDRLPELARDLSDIESVTELSRRKEGSSRTFIDNEWRVRYQLPAFARSFLGTSGLGWIDRNTWNDDTNTCDWTIEPFFMRDQISCSGRTVFGPAMGGQGSRVVLEGSLDLNEGFARMRLGAVTRPLSGVVETIVTTALPKNFRGVLEAAAKLAH